MVNALFKKKLFFLYSPSPTIPKAIKWCSYDFLISLLVSDFQRSVWVWSVHICSCHCLTLQTSTKLWRMIVVNLHSWSTNHISKWQIIQLHRCQLELQFWIAFSHDSYTFFIDHYSIFKSCSFQNHIEPTYTLIMFKWHKLMIGQFYDPFWSIFFHLQQNWGADSHFEVLN